MYVYVYIYINIYLYVYVCAKKVGFREGTLCISIYTYMIYMYIYIYVIDIYYNCIPIWGVSLASHNLFT